MISLKKGALAVSLATTMMLAPGLSLAKEEIPRAPSTPTTPKNWVAPPKKMHAQVLVDEIIAQHPEVISVTMHATPPGEKGFYTMFAGSFSDRIGNESSPGDVITIVKGVTQVESKWGTPNWKQKVSIVAPLKDSSGNYLPAAIIIAFSTSPDDGRLDTDFLIPGVRIRDGLSSRISNLDSLFAAAK